MSARQRRRRLEKKTLAKGPPVAVRRRRILPRDKPLSEMTTDELREDCFSRLYNIAHMQLDEVERRLAREWAQRAPKTFAGGPLQPPPSPVVVRGPKPAPKVPRTVRPGSRSFL